MQVGFGTPYAVFHEFGTQSMPRRQMVFDDPEAGTLAPDDQDSILDIIRTYLAG